MEKKKIDILGSLGRNPESEIRITFAHFDASNDGADAIQNRAQQRQTPQNILAHVHVLVFSNNDFEVTAWWKRNII
jgi:hypothetical protein